VCSTCDTTAVTASTIRDQGVGPVLDLSQTAVFSLFRVFHRWSSGGSDNMGDLRSVATRFECTTRADGQPAGPLAKQK
jgi:hypothetical protein